MRNSLPRRLLAALGAVAAIAIPAALARPACADGADARMLSVPPINLQGSTGLLLVPTAETMPYGTYALGVNRVAHRYRPYIDQAGDTVAHCVTAGVLPRLEVSATFMNHDGKLGSQFRDDLGHGFGGWNHDRMFSVQAVLVPQSKRFPFSIGAGTQDPFGTGAFRARYLVATRRWSWLGLTAGSGTGFLGSKFWGIDVSPAPWARLMLEDNGKETSFGATLQWHHWRITPYAIGLDTFQGGITYLQNI